MYDYMRALKERFYHAPQTEWDDQIQALRWELANERERRYLLRLLDAESMLQEEISLTSFTAGFRLTMTTAKELSLEEPYSFFQEDEEQMIDRLRREEEIKHVEAQTVRGRNGAQAGRLVS